MKIVGNPALVRTAALLPSLAIAIVFLWPAVTGSFLPWTDLRGLGYIVQIESLAMALGMFLVWPLLIPSQTRAGYIGRNVAFAGLLAFFSPLIIPEWGFSGLVDFVLLVTVTYGGSTLLIRDQRLRNYQAVFAAIRWLLLLAIFFTLVVVFEPGGPNVSSWDRDIETVHLGAVFFSVLFLLELTLFAFANNILTRYLDEIAAREAARESALEESIVARRRLYGAALDEDRDKERETPPQ